MERRNQCRGLDGKVNSPNLRAMCLSRKIGRKLAEEYPEILNRYKRGETMVQLAEFYIDDPNITLSVQINSIYNCLRVFTKKRLISPNELRKIGREHTSAGSKESGKVIGKRAYKNRTACFGISPEKRSEISRQVAYNMGKEYGKANYAKTLSRLSEEEKREIRRNSNRSQGHAPYDEIRLELYCGYFNEIELISHLREDRKLEWKEIANEANRYFGNNRNYGAIRTNYNNNWKGKI